MSAAGRARIAAAQKARWARIKGRKFRLIPDANKRTMSAGARRRIAAAQKGSMGEMAKGTEDGIKGHTRSPNKLPPVSHRGRIGQRGVNICLATRKVAAELEPERAFRTQYGSG